jgi:septum site-determining protein MinC
VKNHPDVAVIAAVGEELAGKRAFLVGRRIAVDVGRHALDDDQLAALGRLFETHELTLWAVLAEDAATREAARRAGLATRLSGSATDLEGNALAGGANGEPAATKEPPLANALLLRETVRSGRAVWHDGHVVIVGDVNPGAEVMAAGSVIVWGRLRGLVHAGALGDATAVICALELNPTQLRIAGHIAVAPDNGPGRAPEQAAIRDGQIVAEPWGARHGG